MIFRSGPARGSSSHPVVLLIALVTVAAALGLASPVSAQTFGGYGSLMFDAVPNVDASPERDGSTLELRPRLVIEARKDFGSSFRLTLIGFAEAIVADRGRPETVTDVILRAQEAHAEFLWSKADVRIGMSRLAWGRLDEFQPTDVVNPLDLTKFFFEGRNEARMAVAMVRARLVPSDRFNVEGVYVPFFFRGEFDQLDEPTAPLNIAPGFETVRQEPIRAGRNAQGGVRVNATTGRVDWSVSAYRGFESTPLYQLEPLEEDPPSARLLETYPRFEMVGADFETASGAWGVRGEVAWFPRRTLQAASLPLTGDGQTVEAGIGIDRTGGSHRLGAYVLASRRVPDDDALPVDEKDAIVVLSFDQSFARQTRQLRTFAAYNADDKSVFARLIFSWALRDNLTFETAGGWFDGDGPDVFSRLGDRDFGYLRLKVFF